MAIPAMISEMGRQQVNYGAAVGQSLAQLGQQVGQQLAMKEYQRQATAALPAMQASYKQAFDKIGKGDYAGGYMQMMDTNLQSGALQNPFLAKYAEQAGAMAELAGKQAQSERWRMAQYGGVKAQPSRVPTIEEMQGREPIDFTTQVSETDVIGATTGTGELGTYDDPDVAAAAGLPIMEEPQGPISGPSRYQPPKNIVDNAQAEMIKYNSSNQPQRQKYIDERIVTPSQEQQGYVKPLNIPGYEDYGFISPENVFREETKYTEKYTQKGPESSRTIEPKQVNQEQVNTFNGAMQNAINASQFIASSKDLSLIAEKVGNDWKRVKLNIEGDESAPEYYASIDGGEDIPLSPEEYKNLAMVVNLPSLFNKSVSGAQLVKLRGEEAPAAEAAAEPTTGGMPAVQAQQPSVYETKGLREQLEKAQAAESKKAGKERQERIDEINKEIKSLQKSTRSTSKSYAPAMGVPSYSVGLDKKSAAEIERDIAKIEQLVAERDRLMGKTKARNLSPMDQQALDWANANPSDPRAKAIKQKLGL